MVTSTVLGYPRIGPRRELKRVTEDFWASRAGASEIAEVGARLRAQTWQTLRDAGLDQLPSNTFSLYDHVLDTAVLVGAVPEQHLRAGGDDPGSLQTYFAMARGGPDTPPLEMTKWFDTNYHYLVPELGPRTRFGLVGRKPMDEFAEALALGVRTRPVLVGPVTFLLLAKPAEGAADFRPLDLLEDLLPVYGQLLGELADAGAVDVQLDEPALVADRTPAELAAATRAYQWLGDLPRRPRLLVASYFGHLGDALPVLARTPVEAIGLDLVAGAGSLEQLAAGGGLPGKTVVAGVVNGRNVWRTNLRRALATCATALGLCQDLVVSTSCSLQHVPLDLEAEAGTPGMDAELRGWLAFARQKVDEVVLLSRALREGTAAVEPALAAGDAAERSRRESPRVRDGAVRARVAALRPEDSRRATDADTRAKVQREALGLPLLPTTTIGSFPQTGEVRSARAAHRAGRLDDAAYREFMRTEIDTVIRLQEEIGLDVLVHGEPERNDMVQYFAERLAGYAITEYGWVQSYGTRYTRPPILYGDVSRPEPITVDWAAWAQSRTRRPVKGMLTGPVTMLKWSYVRDDLPRPDAVRQVALALRDEVADLHAAGIGIIQMDEPALREGLPLRHDGWAAYLDWATAAFRLATSGVPDEVQVHTHMCYSEFGEIVDAIAGLDADVTSVEAARSRMELVGDLDRAGFRLGIGPGVWDIHSPRVPSVEEMSAALELALDAVDPDLLWVNPDCGLKTRGYAEIEPALRNMAAAAREVRARMPTG